MQSCNICHKTSLVGGGYSNRTRATKFNPTGKKRRYPNLQKTRLASGKRIYVCTKCLKNNRHLTNK